MLKQSDLNTCRLLRSPAGFTLIELMVTLAVLGLLLAMAAPALQSMVSQNQASSTQYALASALRLARSTAVKNGGDVTVCAKSVSPSGDLGCGGDWTDGWITFEEDADVDGAYDSAADTLIRQHGAVDGITIEYSDSNNAINFTPNGFVSSDADVDSNDIQFDLCLASDGATDFNRRIALSRPGNTVLLDNESATSDTPIDCS